MSRSPRFDELVHVQRIRGCAHRAVRPPVERRGSSRRRPSRSSTPRDLRVQRALGPERRVAVREIEALAQARDAALVPGRRRQLEVRRRLVLRRELALGPRIRADALRGRDAAGRVDAEPFALVLTVDGEVDDGDVAARRAVPSSSTPSLARDRRRPTRPTGSPCGTAASRARWPPNRVADRSSSCACVSSEGSVNSRERRASECAHPCRLQLQLADLVVDLRR